MDAIPADIASPDAGRDLPAIVRALPELAQQPRSPARRYT